MSAFFCAGNWKMNKSPEEAAIFANELKGKTTAAEQGELVVLPTALIAFEVAKNFQGTQLSWGGQNCYFEGKGAFTGENSAQVFRLMGAKFCLVGHSERRHVFGEPDELLAKKVAYLQSLDLTPILCVGETIDDRRWTRTQEVIVRQLRTGLQQADSQKPLWIAYEPVWAIGTGQVATPAQVEEAHLILRNALRDWNSANAEQTPILYGGSVKSENAKALAALNNVNGFLIGGASLEVDEFLKIYRHSKEAKA